MLIKLSLTPLNRQTSVAVNTKTLSSYTFNYEDAVSPSRVVNHPLANA